MIGRKYRNINTSEVVTVLDVDADILGAVIVVACNNITDRWDVELFAKNHAEVNTITGTQYVNINTGDIVTVEGVEYEGGKKEGVVVTDDANPETRNLREGIFHTHYHRAPEGSVGNTINRMIALRLKNDNDEMILDAGQDAI